MKNTIYAFLLTSFIVFNSYSQPTGWVWQNPLPQGNEYNNISFVNSNTAFAVTSGGTLEKTADGGVSWQNLLTIDNRGANDCFFLNSLTGYVVGNNLKFLKTTDGGSFYNAINLPGNSAQILTSIQFINENTGFISAGKYVGLPWGIFRTTNAGQSWVFSNVGAISVESVHFIDALTGFFIGGALYNSYIVKTTNGGNNWQIQFTIPMGGGGGETMRIKFVDANTGYAILGNLFKTTNSGINWTQVPVPSQFNNAIISFNFLNSNTGFILNTPWVYPSFSSIAKTTDGGANWNVTQLYSNIELKIISFSDLNTGFVLGKYGKIFKTTDSGLNWANLHYGSINTLFSIQFTDMNTGYACGYRYGAKTTNAGLNWIQIAYNGLGTDLRQVYFFNNLTGFIVGGTNNVFKTVDGGSNWDSISLPVTSSFVSGICFTNQSTGYISGSGGIFKSVNSGYNWNRIFFTTGMVFGKIRFINTNTGFVTASGGPELWKTTDAGSTWTSENFGNYLNGIFFVNSETGYISGAQGLIYKTTNSGIGWLAVSTVTSNSLHDIFFPSINTGYLVGVNGTILKTTDAGSSWIKLLSLTNLQIWSLFFNNDNTGYLVGYGGCIFKTTSGGTLIGINQISSQIPKSFSLSQNYPNPFNPVTHLRFEIPKGRSELSKGLHSERFASLKIYDILGREVATLVNEKLNPGQYEVSWDAANYPSGVYFYKLVVGDNTTNRGFNETKKMVLVK